jgi:Xaa-Pro aminopeptidase
MTANQPPVYQRSPLAQKISRLPSSSTSVLSPDHVEGFRRAQELAFECAKAAAREMRLGWTEAQTGRWMHQWLLDHGVRSFLHKPIVAYGPRTLAPDDQWGPVKGEGAPLREGDVVILDCSAVVDHYTGDVAYTTSAGPNPELVKAQEFLSGLRSQMIERFRDPQPRDTIFDWVDQEIRARGYENAAGGYGQHVVGHRVYRYGKFFSGHAAFPPERVFGWFLSWHGSGFLVNNLRRLIMPEVLNVNHRGAKTGIWAIEPHLRVGHFGCKFEELLVVTPDGAHWLSDTSQERIVIGT